MDAAARGAIGGLTLAIIAILVAGGWRLGREALRRLGVIAPRVALKTLDVGIKAAHKIETVADKIDTAIERQKAKYKPCPHCKETIKAGAVVCKHCHRDLPIGGTYEGRGTKL